MITAVFRKRFSELTKGKSAEKISNKTELTPEYVKDLLKGKKYPDIFDLVSIANAYNVTTDYLLGRTEEKEPAQSEAGQALTGNYNTNSISHSEEVVKNFTLLPSVLIEFAHSLFGADIEIQHIYARDVATDPEKLVEVEFIAADEKYLIQLKKEEEQL